MKRQNNTSQTKGVARALVPFTQKINEINNINFSSIDFFFSSLLFFRIHPNPCSKFSNIPPSKIFSAIIRAYPMRIDAYLRVNTFLWNHKDYLGTLRILLQDSYKIICVLN